MPGTVYALHLFRPHVNSAKYYWPHLSMTKQTCTWNKGLRCLSLQPQVERRTLLLYEQPRDETPGGIRQMLSGPWALPAAAQTNLFRTRWNYLSIHGSSISSCIRSPHKKKYTVPGNVAQTITCMAGARRPCCMAGRSLDSEALGSSPGPAENSLNNPSQPSFPINSTVSFL